ncbi:MAG: type II secretion system protein GspK [Verrucomicrobiales bacterium]|nr:type II secretion system protein GspK [Verrucomicrobiales bacterium]
MIWGGAGVRRKRQGGSSLLLVIWATMMMAFAVLGLVDYLGRGTDEGILEAKRFRARQLAESGLVLARHPKIRAGDPLLVQQVGPAMAYEVRMGTEGTRIAVNQLAGSRGLQAVARKLFEGWGFDPVVARTLVEGLSDWTDADDEVRRYGAESEVYLQLGRADFPWDRAFRSLEEMLYVRGMDEVEMRVPDWREAFTLYGDGKLDVNEMGIELAVAVFRVEPELARELETKRYGADGVALTEDDERFESLEQVRRLLDVSRSRFGYLEPILTLAHPVKRTESRATVGDESVELVELSGGGVQRIYEKREVGA